MTDFLFADRDFTATTMEVKPTSEAGREFFTEHFGEAAVSATLKKSGGYEMMRAIFDRGLRYEVQAGPISTG